MQGKTVLVTGVTDGIGKQMALELAQQGARVLVHGRSEEKLKHTIAHLYAAAPQAYLDGLVADFASLEQVRGMATKVLAGYDRLDVLINNAGVYMNERRLSADGYELTFAINHLAHFLLTVLLLPLLKASAPSRIITVSSMTHQRGRINFDDLQAESRFSSYEAYAQSKLANVLFAFELAKRLAGTGVVSNALHPGVITTKLLKAGFSTTGDSIEAGADTSVYLATAPEMADVTGLYFVDRRTTPASALAHDQALRDKLWGVSEELVGLC